MAELFGDVGKNVSVQPNFNCDFGINIHAGDNFLTNYNVTILDVASVYIGDDVMIGPNTLITTVGHPLSPKSRKDTNQCILETMCGSEGIALFFQV